MDCEKLALRARHITHEKALIIINDAWSDSDSIHEVVPRLKKLIPYFRRNNVAIIWVRTQRPETYSQKVYTVDNAKNSIVTEYYNSTFDRTPQGPEIHPELLDMVDEAKDLIVDKDHYSAFERTSLLVALRMSGIVDAYFCGFWINVGIYSTVADAVTHGMHITIIEDCVGSRSKEKYAQSMSQMVEIMGADVVGSKALINGFRGAPVSENKHIDYDKASGLDMDRDADQVRRLTSEIRRNSWPSCNSPRGQSTLSLAHARASSGSVLSTQKPVSTLDTSPLVSSGLKRRPRSLASLT